MVSSQVENDAANDDEKSSDATDDCKIRASESAGNSKSQDALYHIRLFLLPLPELEPLPRV
jgi:hypothetical protein